MFKKEKINNTILDKGTNKRDLILQNSKFSKLYIF